MLTVFPLNRRPLRLVAGIWVGLLLSQVALAADPPKHSAVTPAPRKEAWWTSYHEAINKRAKQGDVDLLFIGDSITQGWASPAPTKPAIKKADAKETKPAKKEPAAPEWVFNEVWKKHYGSRKAMNAGIGGDRTQHVLWRLDHGNIDGLHPKVVVLMIGTNNSNGNDNTAQEIGDGIGAIVKKLREKLPETKILLLAIFPRTDKKTHAEVTAQRAKNAQASAIASKVADGKMVHYMDIGPKFVDKNDQISRDVMYDLLHLTPRGYQIWADAIEGKVSELLGESAAEKKKAA